MRRPPGVTACLFTILSICIAIGINKQTHNRNVEKLIDWHHIHMPNEQTKKGKNRGSTLHACSGLSALMGVLGVLPSLMLIFADSVKAKYVIASWDMFSQQVLSAFLGIISEYLVGNEFGTK